ncbi:sodium:proton antiporter [Agromyces intestinalis]|uniref:Sodium:proton antiporter n=1 Tax=Agromyces intestinalis TaxID=2592652 RepID=A0A5C1YET9_9MICO|nr:sodium:proton antiporter [Agromyces intestinalis]QEO14208.1 sodium:proton antiporter [Agromyces intestinalis]
MLDFGVIAVLGVAVIVAVTAFSKRLGIAAPIILVLVGIGISYIPTLPSFEVPHELILDGLLPPILYAAAISVPTIDFRRNFSTIASLSVALVIVSAFVIGLVLNAIIPVGFAVALAVGAIVSPPDAVAATSIGRRLGLPPRILTVLEGEGLVNDATALVLLRSAVAAAAGGMLSPWEISIDFLYAVVVAVVIGLAVGWLTVRVRSRFVDPVLDTAVSIVVPFVAFMPTEQLHASGVLAVVVAGLYTGHASPTAFSAQARISDRINWRTIQFVLENAVFLLIGLEIRSLVEHVHSAEFGVWAAIGVGAIISVILAAVRFAWVFPMLFFMGRDAQRAEVSVYRMHLALLAARDHPPANAAEARRRERARRFYERRRADLDELRREHIDWRGGVVLGWSGMRGVVTLAAAQSLPPSTPYREQLVLIAFTVAVLTVVVQGGTLPLLIRLLRISGRDELEDRRSLASLLDELGYAGLAALDDPLANAGVDPAPDVIERARQASFLRAESAWEAAHDDQDGVDVLATAPHHEYRQLRLAIVDAERAALAEARSHGAYPSRILAQAQSMLDLEETRLRPAREGH